MTPVREGGGQWQVSQGCHKGGRGSVASVIWQSMMFDKNWKSMKKKEKNSKNVFFHKFFQLKFVHSAQSSFSFIWNTRVDRWSNEHCVGYWKILLIAMFSWVLFFCTHLLFTFLDKVILHLCLANLNSRGQKQLSFHTKKQETSGLKQLRWLDLIYWTIQWTAFVLMGIAIWLLKLALGIVGVGHLCVGRSSGCFTMSGYLLARHTPYQCFGSNMNSVLL